MIHTAGLTPAAVFEKLATIQMVEVWITGLSGDMALRIEKAFGPKMDTLLRMQSSYDIARTRRRQDEIRVRRYEPLTSPLPAGYLDRHDR